MTENADPHAPRAFVPALISVGLVVSVISALGAPLIPAMARDFGASLDATQWSLTATMLTGAVVSPLVGRLGDGRHRRRVLLWCLAVVTVGGVVAAAAPGLWWLVAGRAMQGVGLALMPLTMASAREHLPPARSASVIAALSVTAVVGIGLGYPLTGLVATTVGAHAAFWLGPIASGAALVLAAVHIPGTGRVAPPARLDVAGAVLIGGGVLALLVVFEKAALVGWTSAPILALFATAAVLIALWVVNELRVEAPLVDLRLVRHPAALTANVTGLVLGTAMYLGISLITQIVQLPQGMGASPFVAGLCLVPLAVASASANRLLPAIRTRVTPRAVLPAGSLVIGAGLAFFGLTGDAVWQAAVTMGIVGLGLGVTFAAMPALIVGAVPPHETASAMSFYQVSRYVGFALGTGLAVTLLRVFSSGAATPGPAAYAHTALTGGAVCVLAAVVAWLLPAAGGGGMGTRPVPVAAGTRAPV